MQIATTRFGSLKIEDSDIISFPQGIVGFEMRRRWVLLADAVNEAVGWLQCLDQAELALAVVSPRRFVPDYRVRLVKSELAPLQLEDSHRAYVLTVVNKNQTHLTINLKAPLIINLNARLGRQVITSDEQPLQKELVVLPVSFRKSA